MLGKYYDELKERIANKGVIVVAGVGVSANTVDASQRHYTSWQKWLLTGIEHCKDLAEEDWCRRQQQAIENGDLDEMLSAAGLIQKKLGGREGGEFANWVKQTVGSLKVKYPELIKAIVGLNVPIIKTNYDPLIENVTNLERATWKEKARAQNIINGDERAILHLHGHHLEPHTMIVSALDYQDIQTKEITQDLQKVMATRSSLLFVGCGATLDDPNLGGLVDWLQDFKDSHNRHYFLVRHSEVGDYQKRYPLTETRIVILGYGDNYGDLTGFLTQLAPIGVSESKEGATPALNLPGKPRFIGREKELNDLVQTLLEPEPKPTPVIGTLGIGKSNLCQTMLYHPKIIERYGNRRFFVRCDGALNKASLVSEIARQLNLPEGQYLDFRVEQELRRASVLLVLDNFETPWQEDTQEVETYLANLCAIQGLTLVITLRSMTRPRGISWRDPIEPKLLSRPDSRKLFLEVAGEHFTDDNHLDKLVSDLDGLPLAIELLAMRAEGEPNLSQLWRQWQDKRSELLKRESVPEDRLSSFAVSFELSFDNPRMTETARRLVTLVGPLPDGIAHADLDMLIPVGAQDAASVLRKVGLAFSDDNERLRMLAPLREYANRHHLPVKEDKERMIRHYCGLAQEQGWLVGSSGGQEAAKRILDDYANLTTMTQTALQTDEEEIQQAGIDAALGLAEYARFMGENLNWLIEKAIDITKDKGWIRQQANCIRSLGNIALERSDHDTARTQYEKALELYARIPEPYSMGWTRVRLARISSDFEKAEHVGQARRLWMSIMRTDLVETLEGEFGDFGK